MDERQINVIDEPTDMDDTIVESPPVTDNVGETSVEIDVDELITELESKVPRDTDCGGEARKRLEEILERKRTDEELIDFDDYDV